MKRYLQDSNGSTTRRYASAIRESIGSRRHLNHGLYKLFYSRVTFSTLWLFFFSLSLVSYCPHLYEKCDALTTTQVTKFHRLDIDVKYTTSRSIYIGVEFVKQSISVQFDYWRGHSLARFFRTNCLNEGSSNIRCKTYGSDKYQSDCNSTTRASESGSAWWRLESTVNSRSLFICTSSLWRWHGGRDPTSSRSRHRSNISPAAISFVLGPVCISLHLSSAENAEFVFSHQWIYQTMMSWKT